MRKLLLLLSMFMITGCQALGSGFVEGAEENIRLKWAEEWKPALQAEMTASLSGAQDALLQQVVTQLEHQEAQLTTRLDSVHIRLEDFDSDQDGSVTGTEAASLMVALKGAKDENGEPLGWHEVLMAVILGYGGTTAGKEWVKSKMTGTGDGSSV